MEVWKDIVGYEGLYQISNYGRVKSFYSNKIITGGDNGKGYTFVTLCKNKKHKNYTIHRLVAIHFINNLYNLKEVNHLDGNKSNNIFTNLEWVSHTDNQIHRYRVLEKGNKCNKRVLCIETGIIYNSVSVAAKEFNKSITAISNALNNKSKTSAGYHWKYV